MKLWRARELPRHWDRQNELRGLRTERYSDGLAVGNARTKLAKSSAKLERSGFESSPYDTGCGGPSRTKGVRCVVGHGLQDV